MYKRDKQSMVNPITLWGHEGGIRATSSPSSRVAGVNLNWKFGVAHGDGEAVSVEVDWALGILNMIPNDLEVEITTDNGKTTIESVGVRAANAAPIDDGVNCKEEMSPGMKDMIETRYENRISLDSNVIRKVINASKINGIEIYTFEFRDSSLFMTVGNFSRPNDKPIEFEIVRELKVKDGLKLNFSSYLDEIFSNLHGEVMLGLESNMPLLIHQDTDLYSIFVIVAGYDDKV